MDEEMTKGFGVSFRAREMGGDVVSDHFSWSIMRLSLKRFVFI